MKTVKATIENGQVKIETQGIKGSGCLKVVEDILRGLKELGVDASTTEITKTQEFYQPQSTSQQVHQRA